MRIFLAETHTYITLIKQNSVSKHKRVEKQESVQKILRIVEILRVSESGVILNLAAGPG